MANITKRGKTYRIKAFVGYDASGKQKVQTMTYTPPDGMSERQAEREAKRQAVLFEEQVRNGISANGKIKFSDFADYWMQKYAAPNLKPKTVVRYTGLLKRINEHIGYLPLNKIQPGNLLDFYEKLSSEAPENSTYYCFVDLKNQLKSQHLTQAACAKKANISASTLRNTILGKPVSVSTAKSISTALDFPPTSIFAPCDPQKRLASYTIGHYHRLISDILGDAVKWQYIPYNPCDRIEPPRAACADILYLDDEQSVHLLSLLMNEPGIYRRAISLLLLTGLRRGELLGLEWQDIDFKAKTMYISRTSQYLPSHGVFTETPKTKSSKRLVIISDEVVDILREQLQWQQRQYTLSPDTWIHSGRVISSEDGSPMHPDRLTQWFGKFIKRTDLPPIHIHSLRHTYATLCIANKIPITAVAAQLGHSSVATTANIYAHAIRSSQIEAADGVGGLFSNVLKKKPANK